MDRSYGLAELFLDGGWMMYPLLLASLLGFGVVLAKLYLITIAIRNSAPLRERVEASVRQGRLEEAEARVRETAGPVAAVLHRGLRRLGEGVEDDEELEQAMQAVGKVEIGFLERGLTLLATVATVAPLLGFLGTVWGMIDAFGAIAGAGQVETQLVAAGIKIALITTAAGLIVAIPMNVAYNFFVTRIDRLIVEMEEAAVMVLALSWDGLGRRGEGPVAGASGLTPRAEG